jgi:hypothetical protein
LDIPFAFFCCLGFENFIPFGFGPKKEKAKKAQ